MQELSKRAEGQGFGISFTPAGPAIFPVMNGKPMTQEELALLPAASLRPNPIPINVKVVFIGPAQLYYLLREIFVVEARTSTRRLPATTRRSSVTPRSSAVR